MRRWQNGANQLASGMLRLLWLIFACATLTGVGHGRPDLTAPGTVIMLRHAHAPGTGDPVNFDRLDCTTQRNLDERGRAQARTIGRHLRTAGLSAVRVYTSEWCRCRETAALIGFGEPVVLTALNSFFARPGERETIMAELRDFLRNLPTDSPPLVLVTYQVNITALTGHYSADGTGVILRLNGSSSPDWVGVFKSPEP